MLLEGVFAAIPTPFQPDGRPHWHNLERNVERYCRSPLAGLVVLGSTGEAVMLNDEETREALRVARYAVLVNDLIRSSLHLALIYAGIPLYRSRLTRHDAPASVKRAYTLDEMNKMLRQAGAADVETETYFLLRMGVIAWKHPNTI